MVSGFVTLIIFILALGGMIFVHELGHFIAARWARSKWRNLASACLPKNL